MLVTIAILVAIAVIALGVKFYMDKKNPKKNIENAVVRYENEKFNYYQEQQSLLPLLIVNGKLKLEIWKDFKRIFESLEKVENLPPQVKYQSFEVFRIGKPELKALQETANTIIQIEANGIAEIGTGVFTGVALYGGAITQKKENFDLTNFPKFPQIEEGSTILTTLATHKTDISSDSTVAESGILNTILGISTVIKDFKNAANSPKDSDQLIAKISKYSTDLAEITSKMQRLNLILIKITEEMKLLSIEYNTNIDKLERLVTEKKDFNIYTPQESELLVYTAYLVQVLKNITRIDILLKRGNLHVFNNNEIKEATDIVRKLFPGEEIK